MKVGAINVTQQLLSSTVWWLVMVYLAADVICYAWLYIYPVNFHTDQNDKWILVVDIF